MNNMLKLNFYDDFFCTADNCTFTCCEGWEIQVDSDTFHKWTHDQPKKDSISEHVKMIKKSNQTEYVIAMDSHMCCPFLDQEGLCNVVIEYGDKLLPVTCRTFPRQHNHFDDLAEYSLTCACPAVIDIINKSTSDLSFSYEGDNSIWSQVPLEYKLRETMIHIMKQPAFAVKDKLLLIFDLLLCVKHELHITTEILDRYQHDVSLHSIIDIWDTYHTEKEDAYSEMQELFLDIILNYREHTSFRYYLKDISDLAEDLSIESGAIAWHEFSLVLKPYEKLLENCIISKLFGNCISDDIEEMMLSFQVVVTEYIMITYSSFLNWLIAEKATLTYTDIRDFIVIYSRIIEYNKDGMIEFWEHSFDEPIWEFGFMHLLLY
ncbi:MAG: flagellin lysine-N-methylase [Lachnospiraceae bacterium]|nr:flagellin lysine-N-methylase [Lachnospiraceae bacterium]